MKLTLLLLMCAFAVCAQTTPPTADFQYAFGTGSGFKPYQTPIKAGGYAFMEGGMQVTSGIYPFLRLNLFTTYATLMAEGCKSIYKSPAFLILGCGGLGGAVSAESAGAVFDGGGKMFFAPGPLRKADAWLGIEVGVTKSSVPAPVQGTTVISPVQPEFRIALHKFFR